MKKKQKSPTKNDIVKVLDGLIYELEWIKRNVDGLTFAFNSYIEMKDDTKKFNKLIKDKVNKQEKESVESSGNDSKGSGK
jgi:hypothetical protein|tara:strand:+ start:2581 stop:2820 length:240 start_codon:yes stop_codon:yes gene_type:complete